MDTKDNIINAAIKNIAMYGYDGATMKKIAGDCEIKSASIYYFFDNKKDLMLNVLEKVLKNHFSAMLSTYELYKAKHPLLIMKALIEKIAVHHFENADERMVYLELLEHKDEVIKLKVSEYLNEYNAWLYNQLFYDLENLQHSENLNNIHKILDYFLLIGNGVFWGTNIYSEKRLQQEVQNGKEILSVIFKDTASNKG